MAEVHVLVRATVLRWYDTDGCPWWLEVSVGDRHGCRHLIREKEPVLFAEPVPLEMRFPFDLWLPAKAQELAPDRLEVAFARGVETLDGSSGLVVAPEDVLRA